MDKERCGFNMCEERRKTARTLLSVLDLALHLALGVSASPPLGIMREVRFYIRDNTEIWDDWSDSFGCVGPLFYHHLCSDSFLKGHRRLSIENYPSRGVVPAPWLRTYTVGEREQP
jgi:hypothetical protein